ncbi:sigma-70 family RNA polymerase sigma factor [Hoeflea sp.]|uniref:sigma-70 family RNA polymerase sigma factor n=1 Tax=Hoeflea sp. TaxID=1940281 RepID=UPI003B0242AD
MVNAADADRELVARIAKKDDIALQALFARHNVRIFRFVLRLVAIEAIAEELTNEVYLQVWRSADGFRGNSTVSTWMFTIARNLAMSHLRKKGTVVLDDDYAEQLEDDADSPETTAAKQDKADVMRACMKKLSLSHREVIDLVYYQEKTVGEVSEILAIPTNTVKTRMFHARKQLSHFFAAAGIDRGWP